MLGTCSTRVGLCSPPEFGRGVVIHVPSPLVTSPFMVHGTAPASVSSQGTGEVSLFAGAVGSSLWDGLADLLAFPISDFYDANYSWYYCIVNLHY